MATPSTGTPNSSRPIDSGRGLDAARTLVALVFGPAEARAFGVRYWDAELELPAGRAPAFVLRVRSPGALRRVFTPPSEVRLAEAYLRGDFDIEGDLEAAAGLADTVRERLSDPAILARLLPRIVALPRERGDARSPRPRLRPAQRLGRRHSIRRDADAVRSHYDVSNDFYALWLDRRMVYSCAYFPTGTEDLDAAQEAKLEHVCRKLRLRSGERFLDIGCGWGALVRHAAARFGVQAVGITLSPAQASLARERIAADGLADRCRVELADYREFAPAERFDKIASVGMVEHVGFRNLPRYFTRAFELLKPGGLFLNHGIAALAKPRRRTAERLRHMLWREDSFVQRYVFPDGQLPPLARIVSTAEAAGFETSDVETLRAHYALTLRQWARRLERAAEAAKALVGEEAYRIWRLEFAGCAHAFATGSLSLAQVLLARPDAAGRSPAPLTRADLYRAAPPTNSAEAA